MNRLNIWMLLWLLTLLSCQQNTTADRPKNILLLCIDDLRPELYSFGATHIKSPNIDSLASIGRPFYRHYVNAPSCGPSRYALLTGQYGIQYRTHQNQSLFSRAKDLAAYPDSIPLSMPGWFRQHGYTTVSVGKVSHHPGGRGGRDWDSDSIPEMPGAWDRHLMPSGAWKNPRGAMHGLASGKVRTSRDRDPIESVDGPDAIYPDGLIAEEGLRQLEELSAAEAPFFLAIGLIKPHLPFGVPQKYLDLYENVDIPPITHPEKPAGKTTWHQSMEFMNYDRGGRDPRTDPEFAMTLKRYYAACVSYADKHVGDILRKLKETGADKNTIVVLWGDHGWHLGEHAIWGKHALFEESLHSPLIIYDPDMDLAGQKSNAVVEALDIFPTLCDLSEVPQPTYLDGNSLLPILENPDSPGHPAVAFIAGATTIRTDTHRFVLHKSGEVELYDHRSAEKETRNIASENEDLVEELKKEMEEKLGGQTFERNQ